METVSQKIVFDCERMKYPYTGLYHFCFELGQAICKQSAAVGMEVNIYTAKRYQQRFIGHTNFIDQSPLHKFIMPNLNGYQLWHAAHQGTDYYPFNESIKIVLTIHDINFLHEVGRSKIKQQRAIEKLQKKIDRANQVIAISTFVLDDIKKHFVIEPAKIKVIYNGCNMNEQQEILPPVSAITSPFLFTIGTIVEKKNFHVLPALLVGNDVSLVIAGIVHNKNYQQQILVEAERLGVAERVVFTGAISDGEKYWYYKHCRAFVFPSLMEGFGLPVVEAMAFGKPIFLSRLTSLPEIGGDVVNYFNSFDGAAMQETLRIGLNNYDADDSLQERIKERSKLFSWQKSAQAYLETYCQVLAQ